MKLSLTQRIRQAQDLARLAALNPGNNGHFESNPASQAVIADMKPGEGINLVITAYSTAFNEKLREMLPPVTLVEQGDDFATFGNVLL